ncbi:MAG: Fe-S cluster assembly scaffold IscU [Candidatus Contendobacter odensis]|uniref:Fe-S cluster assembly scaffold IscU n=1 Tax=Candidatus Contendibacter odensensis TaxID=1400860 RepID=A0A2G6PGB2_9GAMM|nr:MAG: Fe-S cluster assembly scaffold IscU [Candidatus Contendobacter odensis]
MLELSTTARIHFEHPCNVGDLNAADPSVVAVCVGVPTSGEILQLYLRIDAGNRIVETRFKAYGCGWMIACGSLLTTRIQQLTRSEIGKFRHHELVEYLHIPPEKLHCAVLAETAVKTALRDLVTR